MNTPHLRPPRPATQERGEGRGKGRPARQNWSASSPQPSPPFHGGEGVHVSVTRLRVVHSSADADGLRRPMNTTHFRLPRPATQERGEGRGEGQFRRLNWSASSPRPSPPFHGGEGERSASGFRGRGNHPGRVRWQEAMVLLLPQHLHTSRAPVERVPDFQQHTFPVVPPLVIPEAKFLDVLFSEELRARLVPLLLLRQPVLKAVQFHRHPRRRAVEIQVVNPGRVLSAELEPGKAPRPQGPPQFLLFVRLFTAESAGVGGGVHRCEDRKIAAADKPLSLALSPLLRRGAREITRLAYTHQRFVP